MLFQMLVMEPWYNVMNTAPTTTTTSTTMSQPVIWSPDLLLRSPLASERTFAILFFMEFSLLSPVIWIAVVLFCCEDFLTAVQRSNSMLITFWH
jgi:hypothetical protein